MTSTPDIQPLVSILTPTYNHSSFIRACIESVLSQTYSNWEQIIIDDGSSDDTGGIIRQYDDPRIRYEYQSNRGAFELANTYNRALSLAKGDLIAILEGDDFWPPDKLATLVPAFLGGDVVLAYGEAADVDASGAQQRRPSSVTRLRKRLPCPILTNDPVGSATRHMLSAEGRSLVSPSTVVLRRVAIEAIGGFQHFPKLPLTDYPTFLTLGLAGKFYYCPETVGYRRRHEASVTVNHAQTIHEMVSRFTLQFMATRKNEIALSPNEQQHIEASWQEAEDKLHFSEGRGLLLRNQWAEARDHFRVASRSKRTSVRLAAGLGFLCSFLHVDLEFLMKLGGRARFGTTKIFPVGLGISI